MTKKTRQILSSSALFYTYPSTMKGSARLADLFGGLDTYNFRSSERKSDEKALQRDWKMVGKDIANAARAYGTESTHQTTEKTK